MKSIQEKYDVRLFKDKDYINNKIRSIWVCFKDDEYFCDGLTLSDIEKKLERREN